MGIPRSNAFDLFTDFHNYKVCPMPCTLISVYNYFVFSY